MPALVAGLLEYSRLDDAARQPVSMATPLDQAIANVRSLLEESGGVIDREPLPTVVGNDVQLAQVLQNLLQNALKFRHPDRQEDPCQRDRLGKRAAARRSGLP